MQYQFEFLTCVMRSLGRINWLESMLNDEMDLLELNLIRVF